MAYHPIHTNHPLNLIYKKNLSYLCIIDILLS